MTASPAPTEGVWRELAPHALARLVRSFGGAQFDICEDAVQEAILEALDVWPTRPPHDPRGWLVTTARRRAIDRIRSDHRRQLREAQYDSLTNGATQVSDADDSLLVLQIACDPALPRSAQVALTLRAVCGLTTGQIAALYQLPEATIAQRITRAKRGLRRRPAPFTRPQHAGERLDVVLNVVYLMLTEGHHASTGTALYDDPLTREARRLAELIVAALPDNTEAVGLLALALFTEARSGARLAADGELIPLNHQDRTLWNSQLTARAGRLLERHLPGAHPGPYLIQACITALHMQATSIDQTDWTEILALYEVLESLASTPNPTITLNKIVAIAGARGPQAALTELERLEAHHPATPRLHVVKAHLHEQAGDLANARAAYRVAVAESRNLAERRYLQRQLRNLAPHN